MGFFCLNKRIHNRAYWTFTISSGIVIVEYLALPNNLGVNTGSPVIVSTDYYYSESIINMSHSIVKYSIYSLK